MAINAPSIKDIVQTWARKDHTHEQGDISPPVIQKGTQAERLAIASPKESQLFYETDNEDLYVFDDLSWLPLNVTNPNYDIILTAGKKLIFDET